MSLASIASTLPPTTVTLPVQDVHNIFTSVTDIKNKLEELFSAMLSHTGSPQDLLETYVAPQLTEVYNVIKGGELLDFETPQDPLAEFSAPECP